MHFGDVWSASSYPLKICVQVLYIYAQFYLRNVPEI